MKKLHFFLGFLLLVNTGWGQYSLNTTTYSQNFDGLGTSSTAALPAGFKTSSNGTWSGGTQATACTQAGGTTGAGILTSGSTYGIYNYANGIAASATDRALGFLSSSNANAYSPWSLIFAFTNSTGGTITSINISFDYEKYRSGSREWNWKFYHGSDPANITTNNISGNQNYPADADNTVIYNPPASGTKSFTISGLSITDGTTYYFRWEYAGVGGKTNAQALGLDNFSMTASTGAPAGTSTLSSETGSEPLTISSLLNTSAAASLNFDFKITDDGGSQDNDPTLISQVVINQGSNNSGALSNWTQAIAGAELSDGVSAVTGTVSATAITFASLANASTADIGYIGDDESKSYTLKIWLKSSLDGTLPTAIDGKQFEFLVQTSGITTSGTGSSVIETGQSVNSGAGTNVVTVVATRLGYIQNTTSPTGVNSAMTPAVTVSANDANGNRDLDFVSNIDITSTGTLTGSPVSVTAVAGLATFSSLTHTATGTGFTLTAESAGLTNVASNLFDVQSSSSASDYFRSAATGNWNSLSTWESSADNSAWIPATLIPSSSANTITILNGHNVSITTNVTIDEVVVEAGGILTFNSNFTLADGPGTDLDVNGTVVNTAGTPAFTGTVSFNANSLYQHNRNAGAIPSATWALTSTVEFTGVTATQPTGLNQTFGNVTWNNPVQTASVNLGAGLTNIAGNFTISNCSSTSGRVLRLAGSATNPVLTVGGDFIINSANARFEYSNGNATGTVLNIGGDFIISDGSFSANVNGSMTVNFTGTNTHFNQSGGTLTNTQVNWNINSGASLNLVSNIPVAASRSLTVNGTLDASVLQITGAGNITVNGTIRTAHANGLGTIGTFAVTGTKALGASSTVEYNAVGAQTFTARADYANVIVNGGGNKTLDGNAVLSGDLILTNGKAVLGANNLSVAGEVNSASFADYVVTDGAGSLTIDNVAAGKVFPVGNSTYNGVLISQGSNLSWTIRVEDALIIPNPSFSTNIQKAVQRTWHITPSINPAPAGANIAFQYNDGDASQIGSQFITTQNVNVWHKVGNEWISTGGQLVPSGLPGGDRTVTVTNWSQFSPFAISVLDGPLPVYFTNVKAKEQSAGILVSWSNLTEKDVKNYVVEHSANGNDFTAIASVNARSNNNDRQDYNYFHASPVNGINYYRIRSVEYNSDDRYSIIVKVDTRKGKTEISLYPNPASGKTISLQATDLSKGQYSISVFAANGQLITKQNLSHNGGSVTEPIALPSSATSGMYSIIISNGETKMTSRFVIK